MIWYVLGPKQPNVPEGMVELEILFVVFTSQISSDWGELTPYQWS